MATTTTTAKDIINKIMNDTTNKIQNKNEFINIIVESLLKSNVLNDIKRIQELDQLDIEGIYELKQLIDSLLCTTSTNLNLNDSSLIPKEYLVSSFDDFRQRRPDVDVNDHDNDDVNRDSTNNHDSSNSNNENHSQQHQNQQHQYQQYQLFCYHRRLLLLKAIGCNAETSTIYEIRNTIQHVLDNFLLATTMKDCSVLLSIRQHNGNGNENGNGIEDNEGECDGQYIDENVEQQTEHQNVVDDDDDNNDWRHEMEYRIECPNNNKEVVYYVLVSIIDLDMKPSSKLPKYYTLDQQIVNHYSTMYGLHHKLCFDNFDYDGEEGQSSSSSSSSLSLSLLLKQQKKDEKERLLLHRSDEVVQIKGNMMCRLLYPNPVCLLTVYDPQTTETEATTTTAITNNRRHHLMNVMTITWLTPIDNSGLFVCSINKKRYTAELLNVSSVFVLNVPTRDMEHTILRIGSCSGRDIDKFQKFGLKICCPGWSSSSSSSLRHDHDEKRRIIKNAIALTDCIAHTVCTVQSKQDQGQHWLLVCKQEFSWCRKVYFEDGKRFQRNSDLLPPYLTFLGSQTFGSVV
jgi:flavin reductase (DIM6/NTAB) family NADH-FMN oxidoreductase RutF